MTMRTHTGTYYNNFTDPNISSSERKKIKKDMVGILKRHGFKRSFWQHPFSEVYMLGKIKAEVHNEVNYDYGSKEHGIPPYNYNFVGVEIIFDQETPEFKRITEELNNYRKTQLENLKKRTRKREEKKGGLESRFSIFILIFLAGITLMFSSLTATGNAISNIVGTTKGLSGIILFIFGLAGLVFSRKR